MSEDGFKIKPEHFRFAEIARSLLKEGDQTLEHMLLAAEDMRGALPYDSEGITSRSLIAALQCMSLAVSEHPGTKEHIEKGMLFIFMSLFEVATVEAKSKVRQEFSAYKRDAPRIAQIKAKAALVDQAKSIAEELWKADLEKKLRIGDMADKVHRALTAKGFTKGPKGLPDNIETVGNWIKPAAPDYARKGGRRRAH